MKKLINSKLLLQVIVASMVATLATAGIVGAATTIGNNITTGGTVAALEATVTAAYGLDTAAAGQPNIGTSTATSIRIGDTGVTTTNAGALTVTGATTLSSTLGVTGLATFSNNITVPAAYGLDTAAAGVLNIGTTTANAITIGSSGITTTNAGALTVTGAATLSSTLGVTGLATFSNNITVPAAYGLDTAAAGVLNIGTTTATTINIGKAGVPVVIANASSTLANFGGGTTVTGLLFGTCTVDFGTEIGPGVATTTNCLAANVDNTYNFFVTPKDLETYVAFNSASSTSSGVIQVQVFNTSTSTPVTTASHTWSWMAIK